LRHGDPLGGGPTQREPQLFYEETVLKFEGADCLIWPYARNAKGYGRVLRDGKPRIVSRRVCEEINGPPPTPEHDAAHSCGNGHLGCVTKAHISWKTPKENSADMIAHGRSQRGESHYGAKLTEAQVREIRELKGRVAQRQISEGYGISQSNVSLIQRGKSWDWLQEEAATCG
jgi:hypothetical protein